MRHLSEAETLEPLSHKRLLTMLYHKKSKHLQDTIGSRRMFGGGDNIEVKVLDQGFYSNDYLSGNED